MDSPIEVAPAATAKPLFSAFHPWLAEAYDNEELERADVYGEIAERRAQLECAETLRRVRAL